MNKQITAAAAATLLAAGCASTQHHQASSLSSPAGAGEASRVTTAASNPACQAQLSAWHPAGERFEHTLMRDAGTAGAELQSLISQAEEGAQPAADAALADSAALASTAKQLLGHHLPPPCVPHLRADLTAAMLDFEKQAVDVNNASLALTDWNTQGAGRLLKAASHDITAGESGIRRATGDANSYQH